MTASNIIASYAAPLFGAVECSPNLQSFYCATIFQSGLEGSRSKIGT
jgi:hypothetical protein